MIHIYFDCEFSDVSAQASLISIGFSVDLEDPSKDLYIELADGWSKDSVNYFVEETVVPLLGKHNPEVRSRAAAAARIEEWLDALRGGDRATPIQLLSDSEWDWAMLNSLFYPRWPQEFNVAYQLQRYSELQEDLIEEYLQKNGIMHERHHALVDARALAHASRVIEKIVKCEE